MLAFFHLRVTPDLLFRCSGDELYCAVMDMSLIGLMTKSLSALCEVHRNDAASDVIACISIATAVAIQIEMPLCCGQVRV